MRSSKSILPVLMAISAVLILTSCIKKSPPHIVVEPAAQELGEVPQELIELTYTVRNEGGSDLQILKISTSCDCTRAVISQTVIPPDGSAELRVSLDPIEDDLYGDVTRLIYIRSNDPDDPEVSVEFHAVIRRTEAE